MSYLEFDLPTVVPTVPLPPVAQLHAAAEARVPAPPKAPVARHSALAHDALPDGFEEEDTCHGAERVRPTTLHRIQDVRREQGVSLRRAAQLLECTADEARAMEQSTADLTLSQLYDWQHVLDVPVADLLVEPDEALSPVVLQRARMVRLMKTAQAIIERTNQPAVRRLAETMAHQLKEIMPELEGVTPWHSIERRKTCNQNARILESDYLREPEAE
ncbi:MAG: hypothetical protein QM775_31300 [Pirellulales bacterium]